MKINPSGAATVTIKPGQSGEIFLMDVASTGLAYTLPVPRKGLNYTFLYSVAQTGGTNSVTTDSAANTFLFGSVIMFSGEKVTPSSTLGPFQFAADGTDTETFSTNGTTTGGGAGTWVQFWALSTTQWYVWGIVNSPSGNLATPFST
jgi:hypothetical protein